ncbi:MAG TPA: ADOP family duplicated permease [Thermoanaerobaculia bacterium]
MSGLRALWRRMRDLIGRRRWEADLAAELESHLELHVEDGLRAGLGEAEAHRLAVQKLGGLDEVREACREQRGFPRLEAAAFDVRHALRSLWRRPGFALVAVTSLALGAGAVTAAYGLLRSTVLRPLPYARPERLALVWGVNDAAGQRRDVISGPTFVDLRGHNRTFVGLAAFHFGELALPDGEGTGVVSSLETTPELLALLGVRPQLGRGFEAEDVGTGGPRAALISHAFFRSRFGGDPAALDSLLESAHGERYRIVGVLPAGFRFFAPAAVVTPLDETELASEPRTHHHYWVVGRLADGATLADARSDLEGELRQIAARHPALARWRISVEPLQATLVEPLRVPLAILFAAVALALLLACANVANLLLARGIERHEELAMRAALGASRSRLTRQLAAEAILVAVAGALLGAVGTALAGGALAGLLPPAVAIAGSAAEVEVAPVRLDLATVASAFLASTFAAVLVGLPVALGLARRAAARPPGASERSALGTANRSQRTFLAVEAMLLVSLLLVAGLMSRSVRSLLAIDPGFRPQRVAAMYVGQLHALDNAARARYYDRVLRAVEAVPGVAGAALNDYVVLRNEDDYQGFHRLDRSRPAPGESPREEWRRISPEYFRVLGIPLRRGRLFTDRDRAEAPSVVLVNEAMARKHWPGESPIGKRIDVHHAAYGPSEVIGVVGDERFSRLELAPKPVFYVPLARAPRPLMALFVDLGGDVTSALPAIRRAVWSVDPSQPVFEMNRLDALVRQSTAVQRLVLRVAAALAGLASLLSGAGIFGVVSYTVTCRTREVGLRAALGARRRDLLRLVTGQSLRATLTGGAVGLAAAILWTPWLAPALHGVSPRDAGTFADCALAVAGLAAVASALPALRAVRTPPGVALRT